MNTKEKNLALATAKKAALAVGDLMVKHSTRSKVVNEARQHDIKLALDEQSQRLIERHLIKQFPDIPILGEEGATESISSDYRWIVDPIDGTVNFFYGIPHACVSIALQQKSNGNSDSTYEDGFETILGVIYDPFTEELFTALKGNNTLLNGRIVRVSSRTSLRESVLALGFSKTKGILRTMLPTFQRLVNRVRKIRIMGAAALSLAYVASGRMDAYVERGVRLWDIAAGGLMVECAGGVFIHEPISKDHSYFMIACNQKLLKPLRRVI